MKATMKKEIIASLEPVYKENNVAVVFESSEVFVPYLSVAISSLVETATYEYNYDIIILNSEIKEHDEIMLEKLCQEKENISIRFYNPTFLVEKDMKKSKYNYLDLNYYRLALPWILSNYEKVINLGADIIIERDIAELFEISLDDDCYLAGAPDLGYQGRLGVDISPSELNLMDPFQYINADVLLMDLKKIRGIYTKDEVMRVWQKRELRCAEQDALNMIFDGHIQQLDLRWNVFPERMLSEEHILNATEESISEWRACLENPYIIHYAAIPKPWDYPLVGFGDKWWGYARKSVYYEEILRRMCIVACGNSESNNKRKLLFRIADVILPKGTVRREIVKRIYKIILKK